jgi:hypothetical protein
LRQRIAEEFLVGGHPKQIEIDVRIVHPAKMNMGGNQPQRIVGGTASQ